MTARIYAMNVRKTRVRKVNDWCQCVEPIVEKLKLWGAVQCYECKRPISDAKMKLLEPFPPRVDDT